MGFLWYCSISWILAWQSICWFYNLHRSSHVIGKGKLSFHSNTSYKFQKFIIQKFWVLAAVQFALPTLLYFALALGFMKVKLILAVFFTVGIIISALLTGQIYYWRDQRLLMLNWQNSNQLFGRGRVNG